MFEVGKNYEFRMIEGGDEVTFWGQIEKYEHPLIKLSDLHLELRAVQKSETIHGRIINVTSPNFVSAVRRREERAKR